MDVDQKFINKYIEKLIKKLEDTSRTELFAQTQLDLVSEVNVELTQEIERLKLENGKLVEQVRIAIAAKSTPSGEFEKRARQKTKEVKEAEVEPIETF